LDDSASSFLLWSAVWFVRVVRRKWKIVLMRFLVDDFCDKRWVFIRFIFHVQFHLIMVPLQFKFLHQDLSSILYDWPLGFLRVFFSFFYALVICLVRPIRLFLCFKFSLFYSFFFMDIVPTKFYISSILFSTPL
jgi:hypothetical protein